MNRNEAIDVVKKNYPYERHLLLNEALETLIPDLKESEDERIRKWLIDDIKDTISTGNMPKEYEHMAKNAIAWLKKQGEQKSVDNAADPNFKVGDWVVTEDGKVNQVKSVGVDDDAYTLDDETYFLGSWKDMYHLWTIEDAKDGDILCTYECGKPKIVFILKGTPKKHYALSYYCYYNIMYPHFASDSEKGCLAPKDEDAKPATKEQRDLLFQKIKEAGYEWDAENKELRKIEQKSDPFKAEHGKYYYCIKDYFSGGKKQASKGDVVQALRGLPIMGLDDASEFFLPVNDIQLNNGIDHNVSPKFKVGDWVVFSAGALSEILQIVRIDLTSNYYWFDDGSFLAIVDEDCLHLWGPQDAEDGDILVMTNDDAPFIFKGFLDKFHPGCPVAYGGIIPEGFFDISSGEGWWDSGEMLPANKEQRDLLFQKMKEAGYEWDADKKEVRKIEKNPADSYCQKNCKGFQETGRCFADGECKAKKEADQKPDLSEEDEIGFCDAMWAIEQARTIAKDENDMGNLWSAERWIKSLKERCTWKPSDKQIKAMEHVLRCYIGLYKPELQSLLNDLKKLI